jgi:hypothetical protein
VEQFRVDDLEGWRHVLGWLRILCRQRGMRDREAPGYFARWSCIPSFEGVFNDIGAGCPMGQEDDVTRPTRGAGDEAAAVLGMRILTIDEPLPMPVIMTTAATSST